MDKNIAPKVCAFGRSRYIWFTHVIEFVELRGERVARRPVSPNLVSCNAHSINNFVLIYQGTAETNREADKGAEFLILG